MMNADDTNRGLKSSDTVKLYVAALKGDWKAVENIENEINRVITEKEETTLHVAALARQENFVRKLVNKLNNKEELQKPNTVGNNALCYAAASGNVKIAKLMVKEGTKKLLNPDSGQKPLAMAASIEHGEMVRYLFYETDIQLWKAEEKADLLTNCIRMGFYDLAIKMLNNNQDLAKAEYGETALTVLARTPLTFVGVDESQPAELLKRFLNLSCIKLPHLEKSSQYSEALKLINMLWNHCLNHDDEENQKSTKEVLTNLLFVAAEVGNVDFLFKLIHFNPDLMWIKDRKIGNILHVAVANRHEDIFNLLFELGAIKDFMAKEKVENGNTLLHFAANLPPQHRLNTVSGAALQMHRELLWFKEVEKIVPASYKDFLNSEGETPSALFERKHKELREKGEKWMKDIASSSMLVATLIATVMFTAAISVPGGFDNDGVPILLHKKLKLFVIFTVSDTIGLFSSTASTLIFLSIHTSRYADNDFLKFLPFMLMFGITTLFIALTAMMITFSATFLLYYHQHGLAFISAIVVCVPLLYLSLIFPLLVDLYHAIRGARFLFKPRKHLFH